MKFFSSRELKRAYQYVQVINSLERKYAKLSDEELKAMTTKFKARLGAGETVDDLLPDAFAAIREAAKRVLKMRPFDVQMLGGVVLHYGSVAEMKTGEGKTLTSIAPVYLNALTGQGSLVVTVNEYLAQRDAEEMGKVHMFMGLTVGINLKDKSPEQKRAAYSADVTYSVHAEVGFDYLRDNMVPVLEEKVQRKLNFALIDEVDSILIDEARTPLIISGGAAIPQKAYVEADLFVKSLTKDDYEIDWESKTISLTPPGVAKAGVRFKRDNIYDVDNSELVHHISNALRANYLMARDADYIVRNGKIDIVDAFTGRIMENRTFSDGLHQAIQAKERVEISSENTTLATITYQNFFRMFAKLSGMSGTAKTEENEFIETYNMYVHEIPTNKPMVRVDYRDEVYVDTKAKYAAIITRIKKIHAKGQPILVGTEEVSESERISAMLAREGIRHTVLNAKQNQQEAENISHAGEHGAIMIATNMAGRGTDIKPTPEALKAGGLFVLGTNRAEARRIDNQLRGRSGRQGDIGASQFIVSLDDKLFTRFANQKKLKAIFANYQDKPIANKSVYNALTRAQVRIEGQNFDTRKNVLQYDDVIRQQRDLIYTQRDIIIGHGDLLNVIHRMTRSVISDLVTKPSFDAFRRQDKSIIMDKFAETINKLWFANTTLKLDPVKMGECTNNDELIEYIFIVAKNNYAQIRAHLAENILEEGLHQMERSIILNTFDKNWQMHIDRMSKLRSATNLASYAQKNPYQVYADRGAAQFKDLLLRISHNTVKRLFGNEHAVPRIRADNLPLAAVLTEQRPQPAMDSEENNNKNSTIG